jgi:hypothetical protein
MPDDIINTPEITPAEASAQRDALLRDDAFVSRWNSGDPAAIAQIAKLDTARISGAVIDNPRPPSAGGTGLLSQAEARALAQASLDAGGDAASILAAMADDPEFKPDARTKSERAYDEDFEVGHPERYRVDGLEYHFQGDTPAERDALAGVTQQFVAQLGFDRSGGSELGTEVTRTIAELRGARPEARALYEQRQSQMLGSNRDQLVADAAKALAAVDPKVVAFMHQSGALSSANVVVALAHMHQARSARGQ